jgi:thiamine monophosphate kinase
MRRIFLIARYFDRVKSARLDVETGIGDDCALLNIPEKKRWQSAPTPGGGQSFLPDIDPADLAYKALAEPERPRGDGRGTGVANAGADLAGGG